MVYIFKQDNTELIFIKFYFNNNKIVIKLDSLKITPKSSTNYNKHANCSQYLYIGLAEFGRWLGRVCHIFGCVLFLFFT